MGRSGEGGLVPRAEGRGGIPGHGGRAMQSGAQMQRLPALRSRLLRRAGPGPAACGWGMAGREAGESGLVHSAQEVPFSPRSL